MGNHPTSRRSSRAFFLLDITSGGGFAHSGLPILVRQYLYGRAVITGRPTFPSRRRRGRLGSEGNS